MPKRRKSTWVDARRMKRWACKIVDLITKVAQQVGMGRIGNKRGEKATAVS